MTAAYALTGLIAALGVFAAPLGAAEGPAASVSVAQSPVPHPAAEMSPGVDPSASSGAKVPTTEQPNVTATAESAEEPSVTASEAIGGLRIGAKATAVEHLLGPPKTRSKPELWGADGLQHSNWSFPAAGVLAGMSAPKRAGPWEVFSLTLKAPATIKTARGIGIGSARREVMSAYGRDAQRDPDGSVLIGNEYDGLMLRFDRNGRVSEIFLGALAE